MGKSIKFYFFGHLDEDGNCYNDFAYSTDRSFVERYATKRIEQMADTYENIRKDYEKFKVSLTHNGKDINLGIAEAEYEQIEFNRSDYKDKAVCFMEGASFSIDTPNKEDFEGRVLINYKDKPLVMVPESDVFQSFRYGIYLKPIE